MGVADVGTVSHFKMLRRVDVRYQKVIPVVVGLGISSVAFAAGGDPIAPIILGLIVLLLGARVGAYLCSFIGQPAVLGELIAGMILGNLALIGFDGLEFIKTSETLQMMASIGVILLLFEVGLESDLKELMQVGASSLLVAVVGVIAPFFLGWVTSYWLMPDKSVFVHAFVGATLCATSVGITARVLKDLHKMHLQESKIILGAAVVDDVLGLIILAVVSGIISSSNLSGGEGTIDFASVGWISFKAIGFLLGALVIGLRLAPYLFRFGAKLKQEGMLLTLSLCLCFLLSYLADMVGLAPIVGAFAAGLIIDGTGFEKFFDIEPHPLDDSLLPVSRFFSPLFFVSMGMKVDLMTFINVEALGLAAALIIAAILGKQVCSVGALEKGLNRMSIGLGMIPRGEVGLIFAAIGSSLMVGGVKIVDETLFSAIVIMVMVTTMITPPLLKWSLTRNSE